MKELQYGGGTFLVEDAVAEALEKLGDALEETGMTADVKLWPSGQRASIEFTLGRNRDDGRGNALHAKPASGEGSHFGFEDI